MKKIPLRNTSEDPHEMCEECYDSGWVGDNGPGVLKNNEYERCPCDSSLRLTRRLKRLSDAACQRWVSDVQKRV